MKYTLLIRLPVGSDFKAVINTLWKLIGTSVYSIQTRHDMIFLVLPFDPSGPDWAETIDSVIPESGWSYYRGGLSVAQVLERYDAECKEAVSN